jgi:triacylglycerol esterase/lipase EstA (alpha/beta hydrolase family)
LSLLLALLKNIPGVETVVVDYLFDAKGKKNAHLNTHQTIEVYAKKVEEAYQQAQKDYPGVYILLVGHSLGGVILRYLSLKGLFPSRDMVLIGTPNKGIDYSSVGGPYLGLVIFPLFYLLSHRRLKNVPVYRQLLKGSKFIKDLNRSRIPGDAYYIYGKRDTTVPEWSANPLGLGEAVDCDHHLVPFNGRKFDDLTSEEIEVYKNSAIPVVLRIVNEKLVEIKARV